MKMRFLLPALLLAGMLLCGGCAKQQPVEEASPSAAAGESADNASLEPAQADPEKPTATPNPRITKTQGQVLPDLDGKHGVEGAISALSEDEMDVRVASETYHFLLKDEAKRILGIFNKDAEHPRILDGTFVIVYYEDTDEGKVAQRIEIVESN